MTTLSTLSKRKYLDQLDYESPDAVLGNLMSDCNYQLRLKNIIDPCDWLHRCSHQDLKMTPQDRRIIVTRQPMFYNVTAHRMVNKRDVTKIISQL